MDERSRKPMFGPSWFSRHMTELTGGEQEDQYRMDAINDDKQDASYKASIRSPQSIKSEAMDSWAALESCSPLLKLLGRPRFQSWGDNNGRLESKLELQRQPAQDPDEPHWIWGLRVNLMFNKPNHRRSTPTWTSYAELGAYRSDDWDSNTEYEPTAETALTLSHSRADTPKEALQITLEKADFHAKTFFVNTDGALD